MRLSKAYSRPNNITPLHRGFNRRSSFSFSSSSSSAPSERLARRPQLPVQDVSSLRTRVRSILTSTFTDGRTLSRIVSNVGKAQLMAELEKLDIWFGDAVDRGKMQPNPYVYSALVDAYSRNGDFRRAEKLLEVQRVKQVPTVQAYTAMLNAYLSRGYLARAEVLLKQMQTNGVQPTLVTYHSLLVYYAERGLVEKFEATMKEMDEKQMQPDEISLAKLMTIFSKANNHALVERLAKLAFKSPTSSTPPSPSPPLSLDSKDPPPSLSRATPHSPATLSSPPPSLSSSLSSPPPSLLPEHHASLPRAVQAALWEPRIHTALKLSDPHTALQLTKQAMAAGVSITPNTLGHVLNRLVRSKQLDLEFVHQVASLSYPPSTVTFNMVITELLRSDQTEQAIGVLQAMKNNRIPCDADTYSRLLYDFATRGDAAKFDQLLKELQESGLPFSDVTYRVLLKSFLLLHDYNRARAMLREVREKRIPLKQVFLDNALKQLVDEMPPLE